MKVKSFAIKMLKKDPKQNIFFIMAIVLSVIVILNIFNIIYNDNLLQFQKEYSGKFNIIAFIMMGISVFFVFFASSFFLLNKTKELGIAALSGLSTFDLAKILLWQSFILIIIGIILGVALGVSISPIFLYAMFNATNITANIFDISKTGLYITIFFILLLGVYVVAFNWGYVYRTELIDLINLKKQVNEKDNRMVKVPKTAYIVLFFSSLILPFLDLSSPDGAVGVLGIVAIATYGTQGVIRRYIPYKILDLKKKIFFNDKLKLISLSNVYNSMIKSIPLVVVMAIGSTLLISLIGANNNVPSVKVICNFTYVIITILIAISIIYKVLIEAYNRRNIFVQLRLIGYSRAQIIKILSQESIIFNGIIVGIPLFHISLLLITFIKSGVISLILAVFLIAIFIFAYLASAIISYLGYKKIIIHYLYGGE